MQASVFKVARFPAGSAGAVIFSVSYFGAFLRKPQKP
jgi:hypothetical protein